jgi:hypothetical protein
VLVVTDVLAHLGLERGLQHRLGQPRQQPTRPNEIHSVGPGLLDKLLGELLVINLSRHGLDRLGHCWSFLRASLGVSDQLHRSSDRPRLA